MKKRIVFIFCMISCMLMVAGCTLIPTNDSFDKSNLETQTDSFIESWFSADFSGTIEAYKDSMDEATLKQYTEFLEMQKKYKSVKEKLKTDFTITSDSATVKETLLCENGEKIIFNVSFGEDGNIQANEDGSYVFSLNEYKSMGQTMATAGINSIMCIGVVFAALIFISLLIGCLKYIGMIQKRTEVSAVPEGSTTVQEVQEEDLTDDSELVAVITAAIAADDETESADGLVVRSIVRRD